MRASLPPASMTADAVTVPGGPSARNWSSESRPRSHRMTAGERVVQRPPATTSSLGVIDAVIRISPGRQRGTSASARAETLPSTRPRAAGAAWATMGSRSARSSRACAVRVRPSSRRPWAVAESLIAGNSSAAIRSRPVTPTSRRPGPRRTPPSETSRRPIAAVADTVPRCALARKRASPDPSSETAAGSPGNPPSATGPSSPSARPSPPQSQVPRSISGVPRTRAVKGWTSTRTASSTTAARRPSIGTPGRTTRGVSSVPVHREKPSLLASR